MSLGGTRSDYTPPYEFLTKNPNFGRTRKPGEKTARIPNVLLVLISARIPNVARPARRSSSTLPCFLVVVLLTLISASSLICICSPSSGRRQSGEEEDHQEKSVLKKVRDKAKKIKNKFTNHGGGHEQDHHDPDEKDGEEEEGLEVHDATTTGSRPTGQGDSPKVPMAEFGDTKTAAMHDHDPKVPHSENTDYNV